MLKVITGFEDYKPWSGAVDFYYEIKKEDKLKDFEYILEDLYPEGISMTEINDILWFEEEQVREWLDIPSEEQVRDDALEWWNDNKMNYCKEEYNPCDIYDACMGCPYDTFTHEFITCEDNAVAHHLGYSLDDVIELYKKENDID